MSDEIAIRVKNLGKRYKLGQQTGGYKTLGETITRAVKSPFQRLQRQGSEEKDEAGTFWALRDVSFEVKKGEAIGIIGRNGAGKSTLLKILSRITAPTEGTVEVHGRIGSLLEVGTGFHPELTGRENIFLSGSIMGMKKAEIEEKFDQIVKFAEIEQFLDTPVKRYSSGMYVRLAFAVAAHLEPEILIVDEVLAVGDAAFQKKCLGKMGAVAEEGRTVLFVSHNITAIRNLCKRGILLKNGKIDIKGPIESVIETYTSEIQENRVSMSWPDPKYAPRNSNIILKDVSIRDESGKQLETIYTDTPFNIMIHYEVLNDNSSSGFTVTFYDNENNCIFGSINNHEPNYYNKQMSKGDYFSICKIPGDLFNNGIFNMSVNIFGKNFSDNNLTNEVLRFEILDGSTVRGDYYGGYGGVIRPLLQWVTEKTN
ncbi:ABC transporter ATP-binding protein [Methanosphaerula subterraneus]|uniref:ABC transporter ATP-binding protein n=1 Tax=Methanosphaerula subterraneus TaxID=3350244 RepID=UPI003F87D326